MEQVTSTIEELSTDEKSLLFKRMLGVWLVAIFMAAFLIYFFFFLGNPEQIKEPGIPMLFATVFFCVLAFIVYGHTRNAYQKTKTVYSGIVAEKRNKASQINRKSSVTQSYCVRLGDTDFDVDQSIYSKLKVGNHVKLHCLDKKSVFKAHVVSLDDGSIFHTVKSNFGNRKYPKSSFSLLDFVPFTPADSAVIRGKIIRTLIFRGVIGFMALYIVYFIAILVLIMNFRVDNPVLMRGSNFVLISLLAIIYFFINIKTWKIFKDLLDAQKFNTTEEIIDKVSSNTRKPGPNSVIVTNNYTPNESRYFYLQTPSYWLPVTLAEFSESTTGELLEISLAKNSKTVLSVNLQSAESK